MDITITLTEEQAAALTEAGNTGRGKSMLRRAGIRENANTFKTPEELAAAMIKGIADENIRRNQLVANRKATTTQ